ncbi:ABC transporter permease [Streptomyces sp. WAC05374]|uniref:ABC transporter permease n=1 Tax=unclassified Streptomyces TaxID=2593676 RepID=UPI000F8796F1|nr:ABC transporter permease [Streptomyces sp. WAC05374]RST18169.1 ABC transporter permease [Streptomyces sp. WAC05374]TDF43774.1 ABC transporter permease [Streptomyces sp. WAC05374]TDF52058.1 ABC transporter permease [Streptomyces sp. WAC05374]TDF54413.1 ABC transporter permease [Streptomyces sp. WAC05374]
MTTATYEGTGRPGALGALLTEVLAVTGRRLHHLGRAPGRVVGVALSPLVSMVMLGYLFRDAIRLPAGGEYGEYVFAGGAVQVALACVGPTAISVAMDFKGGLVDRFRSLPISRSAVLFGHTLADLLVGLLGLAVVTGAGLLLGWRTRTGVLPTLAAFGLIALFVYVMLWLGVLLAMTLRNVETISVVTPFIVVVLPFLSNAFLAPQSMPAAIRPVAEWNPVSAVIAACRDLWGNPATSGGSFPAEHPVAVAAVTLGVLFAVCSAVSLRRYRTAGS